MKQTPTTAGRTPTTVGDSRLDPDSFPPPGRNRFMYRVHNQHILPPFLAPDDGLFILHHASGKVVHLQLLLEHRIKFELTLCRSSFHPIELRCGIQFDKAVCAARKKPIDECYR